MLPKEVISLLSIDYKGLFEDRNDCFAILMAKQQSGDAGTPPELIQGPVFDLSPDLFLWVAQKHIDNNSAHLVAKDIMSNVALAGLSGTYGEMVDMLVDAGHHERAAQIWRADVASHMEVFREFLRARKAVERHESLPQEKRKTSAPNRHQVSMAKDFAAKKQLALEVIEAFEAWATRNSAAARHKNQIALWKTELSTEAREKLPPPDKTKMSEELLWAIIEQAQSESATETILSIEDRLVTCTAKAIRDAAKIVQSLLMAAYREEIWALAYLLQNGCSDDAFEDFRHWMVLQGNARYSDMLADPDKLDPRLAEGADFGASGGLMGAFENAYLTRSGKPMALPQERRPKINPDETGFATLLPTLSARLGTG